MAVSTLCTGSSPAAIPAKGNISYVGRGNTERSPLTGIRYDNIQPVGDLLYLFNSLLVTLFIVRYQLDNMNVRVFPGDVVELIGGSGISSAGEDDCIGLSFKKSQNELVSDTPAGTGNCKQGAGSVEYLEQ